MKRRQRDNYPKEKTTYYQNEPYYNTYYQPVGSPPKKKKSKRLFLRMFIIFLIIFALFTGLMYFYHLERMSMIYKRLKIRVILYHQTICRIMLRAHLYLWKMNVFLNIMDSISKGQHVHYFQRLVNVRYKAGAPLLNKL